MRAGVVVGDGQVELVDAPAPAITEPDQVLVRTQTATICGSDLHAIFAGTHTHAFPCRPGFPGHESVGGVIESSSPDFEPGDMVLSVPQVDVAAAFADVQLVGAGSAIKLDPTADADHLVLAQQLGTAIFALDRFWPDRRPGDGQTATVVGAGSAGLLFVSLLGRLGFERIVVSDLHPERLERALAAGATHVADASADGDRGPLDAAVVQATMHATDGRGADLVIEAAGEPATRAQAISAVCLDGRLGLFGTPAALGDEPLPFSTLFRRRPTVELAHSAQKAPQLAPFHEALALLSNGEIDLANFVTDSFAPDDIAEALDLARHPQHDSLKIAISFA